MNNEINNNNINNNMNNNINLNTNINTNEKSNVSNNGINIFLIIISFCAGLLLMFVVMLLLQDKCEECKKCPEIHIGEEVELPLDDQNVFDLLHDIASKIYEKEEYKNLNKDSDGVYYATLTDIENLNYDVSSLSHCVQNSPLVYFDVENKISEKYEGYPIQIAIKCVNE